LKDVLTHNAFLLLLVGKEDVFWMIESRKIKEHNRRLRADEESRVPHLRKLALTPSSFVDPPGSTLSQPIPPGSSIVHEESMTFSVLGILTKDIERRRTAEGQQSLRGNMNKPDAILPSLSPGSHNIFGVFLIDT
jgi:hypothetical protein